MAILVIPGYKLQRSISTISLGPALLLFIARSARNLSRFKTEVVVENKKLIEIL